MCLFYCLLANVSVSHNLNTINSCVRVISGLTAILIKFSMTNTIVVIVVI